MDPKPYIPLYITFNGYLIIGYMDPLGLGFRVTVFRVHGVRYRMLPLWYTPLGSTVCGGKAPNTVDGGNLAPPKVLKVLGITVH